MHTSAEVVQARQLPEGHYTISLRGFRVSPARLVLQPKGRGPPPPAAVPWNWLVRPVGLLRGTRFLKRTVFTFVSFYPSLVSFMEL